MGVDSATVCRESCFCYSSPNNTTSDLLGGFLGLPELAGDRLLLGLVFLQPGHEGLLLTEPRLPTGQGEEERR